ncbi:hypothetical protein Gotur_014595, partial [Gossypium turneri]
MQYPLYCIQVESNWLLCPVDHTTGKPISLRYSNIFFSAMRQLVFRFVGVVKDTKLNPVLFLRCWMIYVLRARESIVDNSCDGGSLPVVFKMLWSWLIQELDVILYLLAIYSVNALVV